MCNTCGGHPAHPRTFWGPALLVGGLLATAAGVVVIARENRNRSA